MQLQASFRTRRQRHNEALKTSVGSPLASRADPVRRGKRLNESGTPVHRWRWRVELYRRAYPTLRSRAANQRQAMTRSDF